MRKCLLTITGIFIIFFAAENARSATQDDWNGILAKARQEGQVILLTSIDRTEFRQVATVAFEKRFGIKAEFRVLCPAKQPQWLLENAPRAAKAQTPCSEGIRKYSRRDPKGVLIL